MDRPGRPDERALPERPGDGPGRPLARSWSRPTSSRWRRSGPGSTPRCRTRPWPRRSSPTTRCSASGPASTTSTWPASTATTSPSSTPTAGASTGSPGTASSPAGSSTRRLHHLRHRVRGRNRLRASGGLPVRGRDGRTLTEKWDARGMRTLHGMLTHGYPNLFILGQSQGAWTANLHPAARRGVPPRRSPWWPSGGPGAVVGRGHRRGRGRLGRRDRGPCRQRRPAASAGRTARPATTTTRGGPSTGPLERVLREGLDRVLPADPGVAGVGGLRGRGVRPPPAG